jgi:hypothetical protein
MPKWTAVAGLEQQISLSENGFFVLAGPAVGCLVRAQAWALADAHPTVAAPSKRPARDAPPKPIVLYSAHLPDGYRLEDWRPIGPGWHFAVVDEGGEEFAWGYTPEDAVASALESIERTAKPTMRPGYDADSNLPLGWEWGDAEWPGCDRILPTAVGPNGERIAKHGNNVYTAGFAYTNSAQDLATRSAVLRACDDRAKVQAESGSIRFDAPPREVTFGLNWIAPFSVMTDAQTRMVEQTIGALAREAKESKTHELTGWRFGRDKFGCWYGASRFLSIVRTKEGGGLLSGPDDWDWEQRIMPILDRLATDPALNE